MRRRALERGLGVAVLMAVGAASPGAQERTPSVTVPTVVRDGQAILLAAHPELQTRSIAWAITPTEVGVELVARPAAARLVGPDAVPPGPLLGARVVVDEDGRLASLVSDGALVRTAALTTLRATALGETEAAIALALRRAGARYAPGPTVNTSGLLTPRLRDVLRVGSASPARFASTTDAGEATWLWTVEIAQPDPAGPRYYLLAFEPFEGRLVSVVRR